MAERYGIGLRLLGRRGEKGVITRKVGDEWVIAYTTREKVEAWERWTEKDMRSYWKPS